MDVKDLSREELAELKQNYMVRLAEEGLFEDVFGKDYEEPTSYDLANADRLVPDDVVFREYGGIDFHEDDFWVNRMRVKQ